MQELSNYRKAVGYTQKDMAKIFGISRQAYYRKEKGYTSFSDKEKIVFRDLIKPFFPNATIESLFFTPVAKKCKEKKG